MSDYRFKEHPCTCELNEPMCDGCVEFWTELGRNFEKIDKIREEC